MSSRSEKIVSADCARLTRAKRGLRKNLLSLQRLQNWRKLPANKVGADNLAVYLHSWCSYSGGSKIARLLKFVVEGRSSLQRTLCIFGVRAPAELHRAPGDALPANEGFTRNALAVFTQVLACLEATDARKFAVLEALHQADGESARAFVVSVEDFFAATLTRHAELFCATTVLPGMSAELEDVNSEIESDSTDDEPPRTRQRVRESVSSE